jgi:hypothetical protein
MGLDGAVAAAAGDYLMVVDSNVGGWNKADRNISRQMDYRIDLSGEAPVAELCLAIDITLPRKRESVSIAQTMAIPIRH